MFDNTISGAATLSEDINKQKPLDKKETSQGVVSDKLPELTLEMPDADIIKLTDKWHKSWLDSTVKTEWEKQCDENEKYWLGRQFSGPKSDKNRAMVDNLIFESLETFLPQATRRNPEPLVTLDNAEDSDPVKEKYINKVKLRLGDLADKNKLRLKLKKAARHWAIYLIGVAKFGWDLDKDMPIVRIIRPKKIILDPDATIDEDGYTGDHIGEIRKMDASKMIAIIGENTEAINAINELTKGDNATDIQFTEWWTQEYMCWTLGKNVLLKKKNPHWNYDSEEQKESVDEFGVSTVAPQEIKGINHLPVPEMPYKFLSIFNLGDQPMDKTSLIGQNLSNQDLINKRNKQIDKNADSMNGGMVVSLERSGLTKEQAKDVTEALRKGGTVVIPSGAPGDAVQRFAPNGLPGDVYNQLSDIRLRLRDVFGIRGSSAAGLETEKTVRGKFLNQGTDTDRIGGGVTEYLEQFADDIYNWFVQLLYVYDTGFQFVPGAVPPKICISVKEGSLLPKDSLTLANQAIDLAVQNKMSLLDLYKRLEYPNPEELAANAWLEINAPELLYAQDQRIALVMQSRSANATKPPNESISFKDLPPGGRVQMASQAGINISPEEIAMEDAKKVADEKAKMPLPKINEE